MFCFGICMSIPKQTIQKSSDGENGMIKPKKLICHVHDDIITLSDEIIELINEKKINKNKINKMLRNINLLTRAAKDMGQIMESRLHEYKNSIIELGFIKDKKKKK